MKAFPTVGYGASGLRGRALPGVIRWGGVSLLGGTGLGDSALFLPVAVARRWMGELERASVSPRFFVTNRAIAFPWTLCRDDQDLFHCVFLCVVALCVRVGPLRRLFAVSLALLCPLCLWLSRCAVLRARVVHVVGKWWGS